MQPCIKKDWCLCLGHSSLCCSSETWYKFKRICCFEDKHCSSAINNDCAVSFLWRDLFKVLCCKDLGWFFLAGPAVCLSVCVYPWLVKLIGHFRFRKTLKSKVIKVKPLTYKVEFIKLALLQYTNWKIWLELSLAPNFSIIIFTQWSIKHGIGMQQ